jgi:hypothetical protein
MLITLLVIYLATLLGGGPEEIFMIPNLKKEIKKNVSDKDRKQNLYLLISDAKKEIKTFRKQQEKDVKKAKKLAGNYNSDFDDLKKIYNDSFENRKKHQAYSIDKRLKFQELMTDGEWDNMVKRQVILKRKDQKKKDKGEIKEEKEEDKMFTKMLEAINENISDEEKRSKINNSFSEFKKVFSSLLEEKRAHDFQDNDMIASRNSTRMDFENYYRRTDSIRTELYDSYLNLIKASRDELDEGEWKAISKSLGQVYK